MSTNQDIPTPPEDATDREQLLWKELINRMLGHQQTEAMAEALQRYSEGDVVDTPDGLGVVSEIRTESFDGTDGEVEASDDSPAYVVALNSEDKTVGFYTASDLSADEFPETDVDNPEADLEAMADIADAVDDAEALQEGFFSWPESWQESEQPARLIALRAWANMGGRHGGGSAGGCTSTMRGKIASPNRFCADFKDRILGWEGWRQ